jgi:pilus assembly protein Flp/PilA
VFGKRLGASSVRRLLRDEAGATAIEYAILVCFIFLALTAAMASFGNSTGSLYSNFSNKVVTVLTGGS